MIIDRISVNAIRTSHIESEKTWRGLAAEDKRNGLSSQYAEGRADGVREARRLIELTLLADEQVKP